MFHPLPVFMGLRYVRARSHKFFVSFITWASLVGVCVGVAALIVILSVMNGLGSELRERLLTLSAQVRITAVPAAAGAAPAAVDWPAAARIAHDTPGVTQVAPYAELQALALRQPEMLPVVLRGIDVGSADAVSELAHALTQGKLADLTPGSERVIVGAVIAERLGLSRRRFAHRTGADRRARRHADAEAARVHGGRRLRGRAAGRGRHAAVRATLADVHDAGSGRARPARACG